MAHWTPWLPQERSAVGGPGGFWAVVEQPQQPEEQEPLLDEQAPVQPREYALLKPGVETVGSPW